MLRAHKKAPNNDRPGSISNTYPKTNKKHTASCFLKFGFFFSSFFCVQKSIVKRRQNTSSTSKVKRKLLEFLWQNVSSFFKKIHFRKNFKQDHFFQIIVHEKRQLSIQNYRPYGTQTIELLRTKHEATIR